MKNEIIHRRGDRKTSVAISPTTHKRLKRRALDLETGVSHLAERFISNGLKQPEKHKRSAA